jgi:HEAT repeat protein
LLNRLAQRMTFEQDRQVWLEILAAVLPDAAPEAARLALVALNSTWPDIRQLGCDYFERHPQPEYTPWLLPRLQDADRQVRVRTIRILAQCGNPAALDGFPDEQAAGLRQFLTHSDPQLRWEAVVAMARLGDSQAAQELVRQTYDPEPRQRQTAIEAIGTTGQSRLVEPLLRRLWIEPDPAVQAAILKSLDQLVPMDERPGLAAGVSIGDKIKEWARWWEARQRKRFAAAEVPSGTTDNRVPNRDGNGHDERF